MEVILQLGSTVTALRVLHRLAGARCDRIVAIDGASGVGKSTFADLLQRRLAGARLVRLDTVYPGWSGLDAGIRQIARHLVAPRQHGATGWVTPWDWTHGRTLLRCPVAPIGPLIVEGCGAFAAVTAVPGAIRVWLRAPDTVRRARALARDGGGYEEYWEMWDAQWRRYRSRLGHPPGAQLTLVVR